MLAYLLIVICIIFVILKLGDRVKTGYIYCILYYFSIIKLIVPASVASSPLEIITSILQSFLQLDSYFLGYIPVCVSSHMKVIEHKILTFLNPLIVTLVIVGVIGVSRRFTHRFWFRNDSILKAISLLALMSFTTLTEASFSIIIPVEFDAISDGTYVKIQPYTKYPGHQRTPCMVVDCYVSVEHVCNPFHTSFTVCTNSSSPFQSHQN